MQNIKGLSTTKGFIIGAVALLAIVFLSSQVQATVKQEIRRGELVRLDIAGGTVSEIITSEFSFQMIGLSWQGDASAEISVRYYNADGWSDWYSNDETVENDGWYFFREPIISNGAVQFQYSVASGRVDKLKLIYFGESETQTLSMLDAPGIIEKASAQDNLNVINRSGWEADEDLRFDGANNEIWPVEKQTPEKFVIHHTAGGDGGNDPEGTIRGIYYWHATVLGWGDIGYNYLVDQAGNIYEGRYGGDAVIGAHAYRNKACANSRFGGEQFEANFNRGTIGISVLGDYEEIGLNSAVKDALARLIANKAAQFSIEPNGESYFFDNDYPNVVGHRDIDCTLCPGANLYTALDDIRMESQSLYGTISGAIFPYAAKLSSNAIRPAMFVGDQQTAVFKFRNQGENIWEKGRVYLNIYDLGDRKSRLYHESWPEEYGHLSFNEESVNPGEIATFTFTLKSPRELGMFKNIYRIIAPEEVVQRESFSITRIDSQYSAKLISHTVPLAVLNKWRVPAIVKFQNTGLHSWNKSMVLQIFDLGGKKSVFYDASWRSNEGGVMFNEGEVRPGETATFSLYLRSPLQIGLYFNSMKLNIPGREIVVQGGAFTQITRVDS